jgi:hypothetical protein
MGEIYTFRLKEQPKIYRFKVYKRNIGVFEKKRRLTYNLVLFLNQFVTDSVLDDEYVLKRLKLFQKVCFAILDK